MVSEAGRSPREGQMTTKEMNSQEHSQTARDFLVASDREFAAGDDLQGSEKLYGAATHVVSALAQQRGWQYRSHRAMKNAVSSLEREYDDPFISSGFIAAERFHIHFFHRDMEDYEIELNRPIVHRVVNHMLALLDGGTGGA